MGGADPRAPRLRRQRVARADEELFDAPPARRREGRGMADARAAQAPREGQEEARPPPRPDQNRGLIGLQPAAWAPYKDPMSESFSLIQRAYEQMAGKHQVARRHLGRPLTLTEKILSAH